MYVVCLGGEHRVHGEYRSTGAPPDQMILDGEN